ncbi:hypothetical protein D3C87_1186370 [compost metagenome]
MLALEDHRGTLEKPELVLARQLAEGDDRAREGEGADERADEELDPVAHGDGIAGLDDTERGGLRDGGDRDADGRETDQRVHGRDQLGHLGHLDPLGQDGADAAAHDQARADET